MPPVETVLALCIRRTASVVNEGATRTEPLQWLGETSYETGLRSGTTHIKVSTPTDPQADALPLARSLQVCALYFWHRVDRSAPLRWAGLRVVAEECCKAVPGLLHEFFGTCAVLESQHTERRPRLDAGQRPSNIVGRLDHWVRC